VQVPCALAMVHAENRVAVNGHKRMIEFGPAGSVRLAGLIRNEICLLIIECD